MPAVYGGPLILAEDQTMLRKRLLALSLAGLMGFAGRPAPSAALTRGEQEAGPTPPRLSFVDGEVSFWRPGAEDWAPAQIP